MTILSEIRYLIIDDEPIAHRILKDYASRLSHLVCVGEFFNPLQALPSLQSQTVDLIFLDLHMPEMKGFDFLKTLIAPPQVIVTTAYEEHALQGYELNVVDYLVKPFSESRFLQAVQKVATKTPQVPQPAPAGTTQPEKVFIKGDKTHHYANIADIDHVEAFGNYCLVHLGSQTILTPQKISDLAEAWQPLGFLRIHKSFLVAQNHIEAVAAKSVTVGGKTLPIGMAFKRQLFQTLGL